MSSEVAPEPVKKNSRWVVILAVGLIAAVGVAIVIIATSLQAFGDQSGNARKESIEQTYDLTYLRNATRGDAGNDPTSDTGNYRFIAQKDGKNFNCRLPSEDMIAKKAVLSCNPVEVLSAK